MTETLRGRRPPALGALTCAREGERPWPAAVQVRQACAAGPGDGGLLER